jgi:putative heme degradation protein
LAAGQDDGRLAIATQVSDHIQRMISVISMFAPDKRQAQFFTGLWMQLIGRMLGPNPDMAAWQNLLARLTKQQQAAPQMGTSPDVRGREPQVAVEQGDVTQQQRSTLGNY